MASTPPAQIRGEARTPQTPLHRSAYHSETPSRYNFRSRKTPSTNESLRSSRTPRSPAKHDLHFHSPQATPKRTSRRTQVISPTSPNSDSTEPMQQRPQNPSYLSANTVLSEGMLPTPVKTPQKKHLPKTSMAARALFQDAAADTPRKTSKRKRHNGFSLESFSENAANGGIQIHVDSRDQVPEVDATEDNPFFAAESTTTSKKRSAPVAQKVAGTPKRRKVSTEKKPLDPQVEEAIEKDEGMVYVFRGKKVYRRFDDNGDEEEVIDAEDLGLLGDQPDGTEIVKPLKTLTRKSIKPRRLFQSENKEADAPEIDEEADTEVEDEQDLAEQTDVHSPSKATRSKAAEIVSGEGSVKRKRNSPFDSWARMKPGSRSVGAATATKSRKRTAAEALDI